MSEFGILMIIFGGLIMLAGLYLVVVNKGDFAQVLLWKSNVKKMTVEQIKYTGKDTMTVALAPIISGILALFMEESMIPVLVLIILFVVLLLGAMKIFKK